MTDRDVVRRCGELIEANVDGELVALHVESGTCYGFNGTATRIWALITEPRRFGDICRHLETEFEVDSVICGTQVRDLLGELREDGLIALDPASAG